MARRGRPKGALNDKPWAEAVRKVAMEFSEGKGSQKKLEKAARALLDAAISGDVPALKEIGDRLDGKATQTTDLTITDRRMVEAPLPSATTEEWASKYQPVH